LVRSGRTRLFGLFRRRKPGLIFDALSDYKIKSSEQPTAISRKIRGTRRPFLAIHEAYNAPTSKITQPDILPPLNKQYDSGPNFTIRRYASFSTPDQSSSIPVVHVQTATLHATYPAPHICFMACQLCVESTSKFCPDTE